MKNKEIDVINEWLDKEYGHDLLLRPNYRIIWSVGILEKRKGTFEEFSGPIFLRSYYGVKEMPKYQYHPTWREKWILEKLTFDLPNPELVLDMAGSYEPIYVWMDDDEKYFKPSLRHVQFYMSKILAPKVFIEDWDAVERAEIEQEAEKNYGIMEDLWGGPEATAIHQQEGIVVPSNYIGVK